MNATLPKAERLSDERSAAGRERLLSVRGEPLFLADWDRVLFIHFEVEAKALQSQVPFELDLWRGLAFVSLVAFTMRDLRPRRGGRLAPWPFKPIATHPFLNVRAYVKHAGESGIYFLAEWLPNRLSVLLGPRLYGLPYRFARIGYQHPHEKGRIQGRIEVPRNGGKLEYQARLPADSCYKPCLCGSRDEFLLERYTAFTARGATQRLFRIWHPPWPQTPLVVTIIDQSILTTAWPWFRDAELTGANYSPGFRDVWMGRAQLVT